MYSVYDFGWMIADHVRMDAYHDALQATVKKGSVVVDVGTGTGIFALLACRFGARHVYAIEPNNAIEVAREIARANGYADRITFIKDMSDKVRLPEQADVIVMDVRGGLPLFRDNLSTIIDARERLLRPGGTLIPKRDTLWCAAVESPVPYARYTAPWSKYDFDMRAALGKALNTQTGLDYKSIRTLTDSKMWAELDYSAIEAMDVVGEVCLTVEEAGTGHGLVLWFDSDLVDGIGFCNAPDNDSRKRTEVYGQAFLPWLTPVELSPGDQVKVTLKANLVHGDYVWSWDTRVLDGKDSSRVKANFHQSSFFGDVMGVENLRKQAVNFKPAINRKGIVSSTLLKMMDGTATIEDIAKSLFKQFPDEFGNDQEALTYVAQWSGKYAR